MSGQDALPGRLRFGGRRKLCSATGIALGTAKFSETPRRRRRQSNGGLPFGRQRTSTPDIPTAIRSKCSARLSILAARPLGHMPCMVRIAFGSKWTVPMSRQKSVEQAPSGRNLSIVLRGKDYEGTYTVDGPMVIVETLMLGTKRILLAGDATPVALARLLLAELADEHERHGRDAASPAANESTFRIGGPCS